MSNAGVGKLKVASRQSRASHSKRTRLCVILGAIGVLALLFAAFTHLLLVSFQSQPECVPHTRADDSKRLGYTAAKSSC